MPIPVRILRAAIRDRLDQRLPLKRRDLERRDAILEFAQTHMAQFGRPNLNLTRFAEAIRLSPGAIKRLFADMDALLGEILRRHLMAISKTLGAIPTDAPDRNRRQRAAYLQATRKPYGGFTEAHLLLIRDRHLLPADELPLIEKLRDGIGEILGGSFGPATLDLLDAPNLTPGQIEFFLNQLPKAPLLAEPIEPEPEKPPPPPPKMAALTYPGLPKDPEDSYMTLPVQDGDEAARAGPWLERAAPTPAGKTPPPGLAGTSSLTPLGTTFPPDRPGHPHPPASPSRCFAMGP